MAQITKRMGKDGKTSYLIRVSAGYGVDGKQRRVSMTWTPPDGWSEKKVQKQLQIEALHFEESVAEGAIQDSSMKFQTFAEKWYTEYALKQLKTKTCDGYARLFPRINQAIGHIKLRELRTGHLNTFYANLQENGGRGDTKCVAKVDLRAYIKGKGITQKQLSDDAGVSLQAVHSAITGKNINRKTAEAIATVLHTTRNELFREIPRQQALDATTVRAHHRLISSILTKAVKWGYLPYNPATNAELPKKTKKESAYLDESEARRLLECLQHEPIKYRAAITFDMLSGLRRGELLGLRWSDVNFDSETITVRQTSNYVAGKGVYVDTPKNDTSSRPLKLSRTAFIMLLEYKRWQDEQKAKCGDYWKDRDGRIFTSDDGGLMNPDAFSRWFHEFAKRNDFQNIHVHSLRHTCASLMIADGVPLVVVSRRLGHAQVSTTANIYAHAIASADEKAAQIGDRFSDVVNLPARKTETA